MNFDTSNATELRAGNVEITNSEHYCGFIGNLCLKHQNLNFGDFIGSSQFIHWIPVSYLSAISGVSTLLYLNFLQIRKIFQQHSKSLPTNFPQNCRIITIALYAVRLFAFYSLFGTLFLMLAIMFQELGCEVLNVNRKVTVAVTRLPSLARVKATCLFWRWKDRGRL